MTTIRRVTTGMVMSILAVASSHLYAQASPPRDAIQDAVSDATYVIGQQDVLNVSVWDNPDLTGKFTVQPDGNITLPLIGRLKAAGLTVRAFETQLTMTLADGLIRDPHVVVTLDEYRGRRIFIFGNVGAPGMYPLPEGQTLIEALVKAGYANAAEAVIVRPKHATGPSTLENPGDAEVLRVNLRELEKDVERGKLTRNLGLRDGDTVFVPRTDPTRIFVTGQVRTVGAYPITEGTTVLQALALAGGPTENAAINRMHVMRLIRGRQKTFKVKLTDVVQPGDTIVVPERYF